MPQREAREGERDDRGGDRTRRARRARDALLRGGRADRGRRARRPHRSRQDRERRPLREARERSARDLPRRSRRGARGIRQGLHALRRPRGAAEARRDHHPGARGDDRQGGHARAQSTQKVREPRRDVPSGLSQEAHGEAKGRGQEALRGNVLILSSRERIPENIFSSSSGVGTRFVHKGHIHLRVQLAPSRSPFCRVNSGVRYRSSIVLACSM
mmetsp:Transcript_600/g.2369  ORF Transcript_600/g.2369 Transcript_600/m.2369 type:complete len:214 (-) Transcript_600:2389-3030(-)